MSYSINNYKIHGQSLFELVIAFGVVALIVMSLVKLVTISVKNSTFSKNQVLATRFAQEGMEWVRAERDKSWTTLLGKSNSATWCLNTLGWPAAAGNCGVGVTMSGGLFTRTLILSTSNSDSIINADVEVKWNEGGSTQDASQSNVHSTKVSTSFTNWVAK